MLGGADDCEEFPGRLLHQAALWDNAELLEDLLGGDQISHLNCRDAWGRTPLHAAATTDNSRCLKILLQAGADPNIKSGPRVDGRTCLQVASEHGAIVNIKLILGHGADLFVQDLHGLTALDIAEQANHKSCMQILKEAADAKEIARQEVFTSLQESCSRGDTQKIKEIFRSLAGDMQIVNSSPNGSNTLLFKACEEGQKEVVKLLLEWGADGRIHPVTKYSPLYIACYYGRKDIVDLLLKKFPRLVSVCTVEKWLPIHACVINGHYMVLELLLKFSYPKEILINFRDKSSSWEYEMPYDINQRDVTGQSVLYLACYVGHQKLVDLLLKHRVAAKSIKMDPAKKSTGEISDKKSGIVAEEDSSPTRHRIGDSIHSLMTKLNLVKDNSSLENTISPLDINLYCNSNTETALHVAVKNRYHNIVSMLLSAGADPNLRMYLPDDDLTRSPDDEYIFTGSTALVEACRNRDMGMIDLLLKNKARDDECKALFITCQAKDELIISKLLALKSYPDPEFKINRKIFDIQPNLQFPATSSATSGIYSSLLPTVPVMINWHGQHGLSYIKEQWLVDASVSQNSKLRLSPRNQVIALYAITRLDISRNSLTDLPECIFQLPSLRILMASQNKLERLPTTLGYSLADGTATLPRRGKRSAVVQAISVLEEIHLKDNRLISLPDGLFHLPVLQHLDVSNNKLSSLPYKMWSSPKLRELNASFNLLHSLPTRNEEFGADSVSVDASSEISDEESLSSVGDSTMETFAEDINNANISSDSKKILSLGKHGNVVTCCRNKDLVHHSLWSSALRIQETFVDIGGDTDHVSMLQTLNLSHNNFSAIPIGLPCLATSLLRLNMSYNRLSEMGPANAYPLVMKQLDLSHNYIQTWPQLPHSESMESIEAFSHSTSCYSPSEINKSQKIQNRRSTVSVASGRSRSSSCSSSSFGACIHRRHSRLENLRTLILADNQFTRLSLHFDENQFHLASDPNDNPSSSVTSNKNKLRYPSVSMLDISNNRLKEIPPTLHELSNLSVLNIAGNVDVTELPPEMGLLSRLWNLNTRGCSLQEPLRSMIESKKYKTMDVIGYLKSILEDARTYARMKLMVVGVQGIGKTSLLEQLRMEGSGSLRKKPVEHWAKRMGNKNISTRTPKGTTLSTVGVDIGDWQYEKKIRGQSSYGPVTFRTWDFGGQREYYATHQYFLSKRSLYLVVWNICDGVKGVDEILQWLVNIQARAPNSPVLIIGTHFDLVKDKFGSSWSEELQQLIRDRFINVIDADKLGLPRVLDTIEISCKTRHNIKLLCNLIYDSAFSLRTPGSKEKLLEQKVPASYLALEDVVYSLSMERKSHNKDPVLQAHKYQALVSQEMESHGYKPFRDLAELNQATTFLHENGVLLHYEDVTLKDLYFLDPQWLCDMLAHVLTIREINPFVKHGVMRVEDLQHVFKSSTCSPIDAKSYIVNLLNKFEVALTWDNRTLLIPSLLPSADLILSGIPGTDVKIPVRSRGWSSRTKNITTSNHCIGGSTFSSSTNDVTKSSLMSSETMGSSKQKLDDKNHRPTPSVEVTHRFHPQSAIRRLFLMSYFPSGFWSRLLTRILADDTIVDIVRNYFLLPEEVVGDENFASVLEGQAQWKCWQTGLELLYANTTLLRLQETPSCLTKSKVDSSSQGDKSLFIDHSSMDYRSMKFLMKIENLWTDLEVKSSGVLEIFLPNEAVVIKRPSTNVEGRGDLLGRGIQSVVLDSSPECVARLLSTTVDHIDTLLEDWYPTLGTRFVHTSEGKFLVTRLVPCPACLECHGNHEMLHQHPGARLLPDNWGSYVEMNPLYSSMTGSVFAQNKKKAIRESPNIANPPVAPRRESWQSGESGGSDRDSGVGPDSASSSRNPSAEGRPEPTTVEEEASDAAKEITPVVYSFMVEECILAGYAARSVSCPLHGSLLLSQIAPDIVFLDLGDHHLVNPENIKQGKLLGRGGFGFVFEGTCNRLSDTPRQIALKMLQPVDPGQHARQSAILAFKAAQSKWERDPLQYACKAYCSARQEVNILMSLNHPNVVPLIGVCPRPLSLVLELAPKGSMDLCLKHYRRSGAHLPLLTLQAVILQIAKALEYLHGQHIIYRDLKSENVLVWELPCPFSKENFQRVDIRLADYGISRSSLPTGAKGFGGTEGFMAPEMMRYNGEEEYTEKVDCFSFGMFMYELLTTRQPYEQCDNVKEHVLEGGRPSFSSREAEYPVYMLDLMVSCWSQHPKNRPSASQIVAIASAPEFTHLLDVISLDQSFDVAEALRVITKQEAAHNDSVDLQYEEKRLPLANVWIGRSSTQLDIMDIGDWSFIEHTSIEGLPDQITAMCQVNQYIWLGDTSAKIHAYRIEDKCWSFSYALDPESPRTSVKTMCALTALDKVAVALTNGRLFLCRADTKPNSPVMGEGTFMLSELAGFSGDIFTLAKAYINDSWTLWCGGSDGILSIFTFRQDGMVMNQEAASHFLELDSSKTENRDVTLLHTTEFNDQQNSSDTISNGIWTYIQPGCMVYHWDARSRKILNKLDCSKLVPCSESLESISIEEHLSPDHCQVSAIAVCNMELFVGTAWGCIIVAEAETMRPISIFRPFESEVRAIIPITSYEKTEDSPVMVVTIGKGYRNLLDRYTHTPKNLNLHPNRSMFSLLWKSHMWMNS